MRTGLSKKAANVERKSFKDLQKEWRTIAQNQFKMTRKSGSFKAKYQDMRGS